MTFRYFTKVCRNDKIPSFGFAPGKTLQDHYKKLVNNLQMSIYKVFWNALLILQNLNLSLNPFCVELFFGATKPCSK